MQHCRYRSPCTPLACRPRPAPFASHKTASTIRARLAHELGVTNLYDLDRLDVTVTSTLNMAAQQAVTEALQQLRQPWYARSAGLYGEHLLGGKEDLNPLVYSFTLYEHRPQGNLLRVNTDNYTQPLDINDGIRLDLGSTAKLRTLVHYLALIADIYQRYAGQSPQELRALTLDRRDYLSRWVVERLQVPAATEPRSPARGRPRAPLFRQPVGELFYGWRGAYVRQFQ